MSPSMKKVVIALSAAALLAGCSTVVPGTAEVDPSAIPKPDTGGFATEPRDTTKPTNADQLQAEGVRMGATMPLIYEIDPTIHFLGQVAFGQIKSGDASIENIFGSSADRAFGASGEVGSLMTAKSLRPGVVPDRNSRTRGVSLAVVRMADAAAASAAVSPALMARDEGSYGASPNKVATTVPGYDKAIAYTLDYESGRSTVAYMASDRYILGVYGSFSTEQIRTFFDKQIEGLRGFNPTPLDKLNTLKIDEGGVLRLTLKDDSGRNVVAPAKVAAASQSDLPRSMKTFTDTGVDLVAQGANVVYRARDAKGATGLVEAFKNETGEHYRDVKFGPVKGAPGASCATFKRFVSNSNALTYCLVPVGRYVAELTANQENQATQAIGASYLILKSAT